MSLFDIDAELNKILQPPKTPFTTPRLINYLRQRRKLIAPKLEPLKPLTEQEQTPFVPKRSSRGLVYPEIKPVERKTKYPFLGKEFTGD